MPKIQACSVLLHSLSVSPKISDFFLIKTKMAFVLGLGVTDKEESGRGGWEMYCMFPMHLRDILRLAEGASDSPKRGFSNTDPTSTEPRQGSEAERLTISSMSACRFLCDQMGLALTFTKDSRLKSSDDTSKMRPDLKKKKKKCFPEAMRKGSLGSWSPLGEAESFCCSDGARRPVLRIG